MFEVFFDLRDLFILRRVRRASRELFFGNLGTNVKARECFFIKTTFVKQNPEIKTHIRM